MAGDQNFVKDKLGNPSKLIRDTALQEFSANLNIWDREKLIPIENQLISNLADENACWMLKHGCLSALKLLTEAKKCSNSWLDLVSKSKCLKLIEHEESRVRLVAGEFLGALCANFGSEVYKFCRDDVIALTEQNLEFCQNSENSAPPGPANPGGGLIMVAPGNIEAALKALHNNNTLQLLETSVKTLQCLIDNCSNGFLSYVNPNLMVLVLKLANHNDSFVRESALNILGILSCLNHQGENENNENHVISKYADAIANEIASGLSDIHDHVRFSASVAVGKFLPNIYDKNLQEKFYPLLLPPLCLNRYSLADGVRVQAQQSWRLIVQDNGLDFVTKFFDKIVQHYVKQFQSKNYLVRQSANHATVELVRKVGPDTVKLQLSILYDAILDRLDDEYWQVRDSACLVCGEIFSTFPDECRPQAQKAFDKLAANLGHWSPMVRSAAAQSLGKMADVYGPNDIVPLIPMLKSGLAFEPQKSEPDTETENSKATEPRAPVPWKMADGCVQLVFELAPYPKLAGTVAQMVPNVISALQKRDYPEHFVPLEATLNRLPGLAKNLGKSRFKSIFDDFIEVIFYALTCNCPQVEQTAKFCLQEMCNFLGPNILKAKIQRINAKFVEQFENAIKQVGKVAGND